eukprot:13777012-Alexandrium_andersonii.AAC.1
MGRRWVGPGGGARGGGEAALAIKELPKRLSSVPGGIPPRGLDREKQPPHLHGMPGGLAALRPPGTSLRAASLHSPNPTLKGPAWR